MKLLVVVSSLDLTQPFSATPAWWQLLKGLYEIGVEIIAAPYQGPAIESLWWRCERNPARWQGDAFKSLRDIARVIMPAKSAQMPAKAGEEGESWSDRALRTMAQTLIAPLWRRHLEGIVLHAPDIDAVLFLTVPLNHLKGVPAYIDWIDSMIALPSRRMSAHQFAVRGTNLGDIGNASLLPYLSFSKLREYACRSRINLCITRGAHASVYGSSSSRPFELSAMAACIVANPYKGLEEWFKPEREIVMVGSADEAIERYQFLLAHDNERQSIGRAARARVLKQHTFRHRARDLVRILKGYI